MAECHTAKFLQRWSTLSFSEVMAQLWLVGTILVDNATFHLLMTEYFIPFYTQVSAGQDHTVLLRSAGRAVAFGANDLGMWQHSTSWWRSVIHTNLWSVYSHSPFEKRWSCCGFRRECSWKMRHSTSRWRNVIQPSFCRLPSHNTS